MSNQPTIRVLAAIITRDDRWLLCRRPPHKRHGDRWEFPGGKLEPGEDLAEAARREMHEELGVIVTDVGDVLYRKHDEGSPFIIEFTTVQITGEPQPLEHTALSWVTPHQAARLELAPADQAFVEYHARAPRA
ncbi:MAG TPA: (deoxy)nucleoside triphosphate pyrophosphohydrolase [Longimicrobiales bacterium]|nr:(deoxy)nucleoside triphosphate pyrophosphohydrolase [Longimicrobiales bacterium]